MNIVEQNRKEDRNYFTDEEKKKICLEVKELIDSGVPVKEAKICVANKYNTSVNTIKKWDKEYRYFSKNRKIFSDEEKKAICLEVKNYLSENKDKTIVEATKIIGNKYGIIGETIVQWDSNYYIFTSNDTKRNYTEEEKKKICYDVKAKMELNNCSAAYAIFWVLSKFLDLHCSYEQFQTEHRGKAAYVYIWNKEYKIFEIEKKSEVKILHSDNEKREILAEIAGGESVKNVSEKCNVSTCTLHRWNRNLKVYDAMDVEKIATKKDEMKKAKEILYEFDSLVRFGKTKAEAMQIITTAYNNTQASIYNWNKKLNIFKTRQQMKDEGIEFCKTNNIRVRLLSSQEKNCIARHLLGRVL